MQRRTFLKNAMGGAMALLAPEPLLHSLAAADVPVPKIRITGIQVHQLTHKLKDPIGWCCMSGRPTVGSSVIEVSTDAGLTGWGDGNWGGEVLRQNRSLVIGRSPFEVEAIFRDMYEAARSPFHTMPRDAVSPGGLDVALWDIVGKALGKPVSALLGKQYRKRVMPYASAGYRKNWPDLEKGFADELHHWTRTVGFRAAKVKTGYDPVTDVKVLRAVRKAIGEEIRLGIDSGTSGVYDSGTAVMLGRQLEELNLEFWEEPINKYDLDGYARLKQVLRIPLASGEFLSIDWLIENYVQRKAVDIVQPDISECGFTGGKTLTYACWLNRVRLMPHSWGTPLRIVSEMHWTAGFPPVSTALNPPPALFEMHLPHESPAWDLTTKRIEVDPSDGMMAVPTGPGLGIEIDRDALERSRSNLISL